MLWMFILKSLLEWRIMTIFVVQWQSRKNVCLKSWNLSWLQRDGNGWRSRKASFDRVAPGNFRERSIRTSASAFKQDGRTDLHAVPTYSIYDGWWCCLTFWFHKRFDSSRYREEFEKREQKIVEAFNRKLATKDNEINRLKGKKTASLQAMANRGCRYDGY